MKPSNKKVLMKTFLDSPNPNCYVCGTHSITVKLNTSTFSLSDFIDKLLVGRLGFNEPNIDTGTKYFEGGTEGLDEEEIAARDELLPRKLRDLDIVHNALLTITDQSQDLRLELCVLHSYLLPFLRAHVYSLLHSTAADRPSADASAYARSDEMTEDNPFEIMGKVPEAAPAVPAAPPVPPSAATRPPEADDLMIIDSAASGKRKREAEEAPAATARNGPAKKAKKDDGDVVIL